MGDILLIFAAIVIVSTIINILFGRKLASPPPPIKTHKKELRSMEPYTIKEKKGRIVVNDDQAIARREDDNS